MDLTRRQLLWTGGAFTTAALIGACGGGAQLRGLGRREWTYGQSSREHGELSVPRVGTRRAPSWTALSDGERSRAMALPGLVTLGSRSVAVEKHSQHATRRQGLPKFGESHSVRRLCAPWWSG